MRIRVYDNGGKTIDRYTVIYLDEPEAEVNLFQSLGMNETPFHPQGFCQHSSAKPGPHLGKRIKARDLPVDCQLAILRDHIQEDIR